MKSLLIAFGFVAANAMACPDGAKDAMAPGSDKPVAAVAKVKPTNSAAVASAKNVVTKVAVKPATAPRKSATL